MFLGEWIGLYIALGLLARVSEHEDERQCFDDEWVEDIA